MPLLVFVVVVVFMRTRLQKKRVVAAFTFLLVKKAGRLLVAESFTSLQSLASSPTQRRKKSLGTGIIWRGIFKKYGKKSMFKVLVL